MNTQQRRIAAAAASFGAAVGMFGGAGHAFADDPAVVGEAQSQANSPQSAQPGMPTSTGQDAGAASQDAGSAQPGMPTSDAQPQAGAESAPAATDSTAQPQASQPGMPESSTPQPAPTEAPPATNYDSPAPSPSAPQSSTPSQPTTVTPSAPTSSPDTSASTPSPSTSSTPQSADVAPAAYTSPAPDSSGTSSPIDTQPGMPAVAVTPPSPATPAPAPAPPTFESSLQDTQRPDFPRVEAPPKGTDHVVAAHEQDLPGGQHVNIPQHAIPNVTYDSTPITDGNTVVGSSDQGTVGSNVSVSTSTRVDDGSATTAGVADVGADKGGMAQDADTSGNYQGAAATSGTGAGYGNAYASNTPLPTNNGSDASVSGQWSAPDGSASVHVEGNASFRSMQLPSLTGGVKVSTPWGNFQTPPMP